MADAEEPILQLLIWENLILVVQHSMVHTWRKQLHIRQILQVKLVVVPLQSNHKMIQRHNSSRLKVSSCSSIYSKQFISHLLSLVPDEIHHILLLQINAYSQHSFGVHDSKPNLIRIHYLDSSLPFHLLLSWTKPHVALYLFLHYSIWKII